MRVLKIVFDNKILADLKWSDFIRADISMGARASSAHFMSDKVLPIISVMPIISVIHPQRHSFMATAVLDV